MILLKKYQNYKFKYNQKMFLTLINPYTKFTDNKLLLFGFIATFIGIILGNYFNVRYDGAIDLHFVGQTNLKTTGLDLIIDIGVITLFLFIFGKIINKKTRILDVFIGCLIARFPFYLLTMCNFNNRFYTISQKLITKGNTNTLTSNDAAVLLVVSFLVILSLIWFFVLSYNGFKIATNLKNKLHIIYYIIAIFISEIISKYLIITYNT